MNKDKTLRAIPVFNTDEEAERFVNEANLTEYDSTGFKLVRFTFKEKDKHSPEDVKSGHHGANV